MNRVNGIFERDVASVFEIIDDNDKIIYTSSDVDPFAGKSLLDMLYINTDLLDSIIGEDNFDVGHVFSGTHQGGLAARGAVCHNKQRAQGGSTYPSPEGNYFLDVLAHELGHQLGSSHTFNGKEYHCGSNRSADHAYEPGSGSTLMGYPGKCGSDDFKYEKDDYFHAKSIERILQHTRDVGCGTLIDIDNTPPTVSTIAGGFVIPISTPFVLEAEAHDADGDALTYCWEQYDLGPSVNLGKANENSPLFRSFPPTTDNKRYFPTFDRVINNSSDKSQLLPSYTRDLNFAVTVRDNSINGGATSRTDVGFTSTDQAGPFVLTSTFEDSPYDGFSTYLVEWDVANTDQAPVNCQKVNILFSDNWGINFDYILLENVDNDGSENVRLPNIQTTGGRFMVEAADNIFYNVSNASFTINAVEVDIPESPTNLIGTKISASKIELSWIENSDVENGFIIERQSDSEEGFIEVGRVGFDITIYEDNTIGDEAYTYRVAAYNETGVSTYSNSVSFEAGTGDGGDSGSDDDVLSSIDSDEVEVLYPSPATNHINLPSSVIQEIRKIEIFDLKGKKIMELHEEFSTGKLNISRLRKGVYLLKMSTSDSGIIRKFYKE